MSRLLHILGGWLPFALTVSAFSLLAYVTIQQVLRQGANDPQIEMAEDAAADLNSGETAEGLVAPRYQVDLASSLSPFLVIFDMAGKPVAGSGELEGELPAYPIGSLEAAREYGENRVTWQPNANVRIASVVVPYKTGYVMAGRSLREVEAREAQLSSFVAGVWLLTLAALLVVIAVLQRT